MKLLLTRLVAALAPLSLSAVCTAQSAALAGTMGQRALIVIDGAAPAVMAPGEERQGVRLISADGDGAIVEIQGRRQNLRIGSSAVRVGADNARDGGGSGGTATRIVLRAGSGGHFLGTGRINGATVRFLVDTGASMVTMSAAQASQIGVDFRAGERVPMGTANGTVPAYHVRFDSIRIGGVDVYGVDGMVLAADMPFVLLGNSFLSRFRIRQENDAMLLERRY